VFWQVRQVQMALQGTPPWKHSQYFFRHRDLRQRQPFLCATLEMAVNVLDMGCAAVGRYFESNAFGFRSRMRLTATSLTAALSGRFSQDRQRHEELHVARAAKHWQYLQYSR
jgi:hypothetical protein